MNAPLKITKIGNSAGVILPKKYLEHLGVVVGDHVTIARTSRGLELAKASVETADGIEEQMTTAREVMARRHRAMMALAEQIMEEDRNILAALAKS